jgi:hypothetical protein
MRGCTGRLVRGAFFEVGSELWQFSVSKPFSPQPPVTQIVGLPLSAHGKNKCPTANQVLKPITASPF